MASPPGSSSTGVRCPDHPNANLIEDYRAGDQICTECGLVVGDRVIEDGSEWRTFSNDKSGGADPSRVGSAENPLLSGSDLTTLIGGGRGAAAFDEFGKAKYTTKMDLNSAERALRTGFSEISQMGARINLTQSIINRANGLFKTVYEGKLVKGRSSDAIAAACVYIACRQEDVPRSFNEVCAVSRIRKRDIGPVFRQIIQALEINVTPVSTEDYMTRFCSNLGLSNEVQMAATAIANATVRRELLPGKAPLSIVAAAIYMASQLSKDKRTSKQISAATGVGESTMRQAYKEMYSEALTLVPPEFAPRSQVYLLPIRLR